MTTHRQVIAAELLRLAQSHGIPHETDVSGFPTLQCLERLAATRDTFAMLVLVTERDKHTFVRRVLEGEKQPPSEQATAIRKIAQAVALLDAPTGTAH